MDDRNLVAVAEQAAACSRATRSGLFEGVTLKSSDGRVFTGCRVEFEDPAHDLDPLSNALAAGLVAGARRFVRAGVYHSDSSRLPACSPVGIARLRPYAEEGFVFIVSSGTGHREERPLDG